MNYDTCTYEELVTTTKNLIENNAKTLADSPKSKAATINQTVGFFMGVCFARNFNYSVDMVQNWLIVVDK
jgi:hypothetical protein